MSARAHVTVPAIDRRKDRPKPWRVRWIVDGQHRTRSFRTRAEADRFRSSLVAESSRDVEWDALSGLPAAWVRRETPRVHEWAREYLVREWSTLAPNSRGSLTWSLARGAEVLTGPLSPEQRGDLRGWLARGGDLPSSLESWARRAPRLDDLDRRALVRLEDAIALGVHGTPLARATRERTNFRRCLDQAVRDGIIGDLNWPPPRSRGLRKKEQGSPKPARTVLSEDNAHRLLAALPGRWRAMTALALFAGLRPGEVVALEADDIDWEGGQIHVRRAWNGAGQRYGEPGEDIGPTKTVKVRTVPLSSELAALLRGSVPENGPLFRTASGKRPTQSNWWRALRRASEKAGVAPTSPYDCRHFFVSHLVRRVPIAKAAAIAGHSAAVLVDHYLHDIEE